MFNIICSNPDEHVVVRPASVERKKNPICRASAIKSEYRIDEATADSSTGAETFASQYGDVRMADERAYLLRQQLIGPSITV